MAALGWLGGRWGVGRWGCSGAGLGESVGWVGAMGLRIRFCVRFSCRPRMRSFRWLWLTPNSSDLLRIPPQTGQPVTVTIYHTTMITTPRFNEVRPLSRPVPNHLSTLEPPSLSGSSCCRLKLLVNNKTQNRAFVQLPRHTSPPRPRPRAHCPHRQSAPTPRPPRPPAHPRGSQKPAPTRLFAVPFGRRAPSTMLGQRFTPIPHHTPILHLTPIPPSLPF
jgi:hypothetical protein